MLQEWVSNLLSEDESDCLWHAPRTQKNAKYCLLSGNPVELDFTGVQVFASPFFNLAIGHLLKDIPADNLNRLVEFTAISSEGWNVLERVIANAKHYYSDEQFRNAVDAVITEQAATF